MGSFLVELCSGCNPDLDELLHEVMNTSTVSVPVPVSSIQSVSALTQLYVLHLGKFFFCTNIRESFVTKFVAWQDGDRERELRKRSRSRVIRT